jgi:pyruvate kinase
MEPGLSAGGATVSARATIADVASRFLDGTEALNVTNESGAAIGTLRRDAVIRLMLGG